MRNSRLLHRLLPCLPLLVALPAQRLERDAATAFAGEDPVPALQRSPRVSSNPVDSPVILNRTVGLQLLDGELWGACDHYKVRFDDDGFEFTPTLGPGAPRNYPLTFSLESIRRGETRAPLRSGGPSHSGLRVQYDHGAAVERYDLRPDAMEQSFVFAERPAGTGDLVVRGRLQTEMSVMPENGGLRLEQPGVGGFRIGRVTGIDAKGARADGSVRVDGDVIELSLPAAFVDRAALPLVLDPPIGGAFGMSLFPAMNDQKPRAAFDATNDAYLVIWETVVSATDRDIFGQRISRNGTLIGTRISVDVSTMLDSEADVANVNGRDAFVVVFTRNGDIHGRAVSAATGTVLTGIPIAAGASHQHSPSVGGNTAALILTGGVVCVWQSDGDLALQSTRVTVNIDLSLSRGTVHTVAQGNAVRPRISKGGGSSGRHAIVYERDALANTIKGIVVNSSGAPLTAEFNIDGGPDNLGQPEVDGDGTNWVATWQYDGPVVSTIFACSLSFVVSTNQLVEGSQSFVSGGAPHSVAPSVMWTGGSALVGFSGQPNLSLVNTSAYVHALDPFRCMTCEGAFVLGGPQLLNRSISGCSSLSGGGPADDALVVWESSPVLGNGDITARLWRSADGVTSSLGGGCGSGGTAHAVCGRIGFFPISYRVRGASPNAPTFLVLSLSQGSVACGPCTLIPDLASAVTMLVGTDSLGNGAVMMTLTDPALRGLVLFEQWLTLRSGGACAQFGLDMSNALRLILD